MFVFVIAASDYIVTEYGSICIEIEKNPVVDEDECIKAAKSLGKTFMGDEENKYYPRGCYIFNNVDIFWNVHKTGMKESKSAEICRKEGSNFYSILSIDVENNVSLEYVCVYLLSIV